MKKEQLNILLLGLTIVGAVTLFVLGKEAQGAALLAFAAGHLVTSPIKPNGAP